MLVVATGAAIVASQALISASFQIVAQVIFMSMPTCATAAHTDAIHHDSCSHITDGFMLHAQAIRLSFFPRFRITHTSEKHTGQIYIAVINYVRHWMAPSDKMCGMNAGRYADRLHAVQILMGLTIIVVIAFRTSARLGLAYGLAVNMDLVLTTCFLTLVRCAQNFT